MSFEENLAKKKKRQGIAHFIVGIITIMIFSTPSILYGISSNWYCIYHEDVISDCLFLQMIMGLGFLFGIILFNRGALKIARRNELSKKDKAKLKEINKDEKIKELEKRLEKVEDEKSKSEDNSENS